VLNVLSCFISSLYFSLIKKTRKTQSRFRVLFELHLQITDSKSNSVISTQSSPQTASTAGSDPSDLITSDHTTQRRCDQTKAPFTRYNLLSNRLSNRFGNRVNVCIHETTGGLPVVSCMQTFNRLSNPFDNRFDNRLDVCLHDTAGCQTGCTTRLTTGCIV